MKLHAIRIRHFDCHPGMHGLFEPLGPLGPLLGHRVELDNLVCVLVLVLEAAGDEEGVNIGHDNAGGEGPGEVGPKAPDHLSRGGQGQDQGRGLILALYRAT